MTIVHDTGAFDFSLLFEFILASALPFSEESDSVPVLRTGQSVFHEWVHKLVLHSEMFYGEV